MSALSLQPFTVAVPDAVLDDLRERLTRSRLPNQVAGVGWEQGTERDFLRQLLDYWQHGYDWRATEARLNAIPQCVTEAAGQRLHLLHARSENPDAIPLLVTHGWPGSVLEFLDVIEPLRQDFHVVMPSLPGFTFSGETSEQGWHPRRIAVAFADVMTALGYERYGLQGGDWGSTVSANLADLCPERVIGLHLNMVTARPIRDAPLTDEEKVSLDRARAWRQTGTGYQEIQGTRPQSLGYALQDSPAGLAAWIVEKFRDWSDADIADAFTFDRLLDNITAYWVTGTAASSLRIYWEMRQAGRDAMPQGHVSVPTAVAMFPGEIVYPPRSWIEAQFNVVRWSRPARGGHFAAMEAPQEYVADVREFFLGLEG
ncbi:MAG TPA: epoxide hydrolase [Frankiaceae bacterium]|jgi:microsomal epoxide hydrolase|nr:epoxide hydrolase [Frankiaceae bacterium]